MQKALRRLAARALPGAAAEFTRWRTASAQIATTAHAMSALQERISRLEERLLQKDHDTRLDDLRHLVSEVEHYQPLYGIAGVIEAPRRDSLDRARLLEDAMSPLVGQRVLDIGSSLGYMSFHLADRGAVVTGWDMSAANVLVAQAVGRVNGLRASFVARQLTLDTVRTIEPGAYDSALILAVLHHVVHYEGLETAQQLVRELLERIPVLYLELAVKGEDPGLFWDASQPDEPTALFAALPEDTTIEQLAMVPTHLSGTHRPIFRVARPQVVTVAGRRYAYDGLTFEAYRDAPVAYSAGRRRYYVAERHLIKEYTFSADAPYNWDQIIGELFAHSQLSGGATVHHALRLVDAELSDRHARLVVEKLDGTLLTDLGPTDEATLARVAGDVLRTLADLRRLGLHHNDVRSWNILVNDEGGWLIDYGLMRHAPAEDDTVALAWALVAGRTGHREAYEVAKADLPDLAPLDGTALAGLAQALRDGEREPEALLATIPAGPTGPTDAADPADPASR